MVFIVDWEEVFKQIQVNWEANRIEWKPSELKENVFVLLALIKKAFGLRLKGRPYRIGDKWAIDFEER